MILILSLSVLVTFLIFLKRRCSYWKRKGIPSPPVKSYFTTLYNIVRSKKIGEIFLKDYKLLKSINKTHLGLYIYLTPVYFPIDHNLIKDILVKNFQHFPNHGNFHHPKDILSQNLFHMEGDEWKLLRTKLSPAFTPAKMKLMFEILVKKGEILRNCIEQLLLNKNDEPFEMKNYLARFTTDVIASCAFGLECNSLEEPDNIFNIYGKKVFVKRKLSFLPGMINWNLLGNLGYKHHGRDITYFFENLVKQTIKLREENSNIIQNDLFQLLLELKNKGFIRDNNNDNNIQHQEQNSKRKNTLTINEIIAQCFIFWAAGFETSSTTLTYALLVLAQHQDVQQKIREEIRNVLNDFDGKISYDAVTHHMPYLEKVIYEILRVYSPVTLLPRVCTKSYKIPETDCILEKGTKVIIPIWGVHMDPEYYPDPEKFNPENFSKENIAKRPPMTYMPFGEGPRICIGRLFGLLQIKVGIISLLKNLKVTLNEKTKIPVSIEPGSVFGMIIGIDGGLWLNFEKCELK